MTKLNNLAGIAGYLKTILGILVKTPLKCFLLISDSFQLHYISEKFDILKHFGTDRKDKTKSTCQTSVSWEDPPVG
jgi:hypothetical protein